LPHYQRWKEYVQWDKDNGMDVYHLTLSLTDSLMKGIEGKLRFAMENRSLTFKRIMFSSIRFLSLAENPYDLSCVKKEYQKTISSVLFEAYVLNKARDLTGNLAIGTFWRLNITLSAESYCV
jgi:hypothetical protein